MIHKDKDTDKVKDTDTATAKTTDTEPTMDNEFGDGVDETLRKMRAYQDLYEITMAKLNELLLKDLDKPKKLGGM